MKKIFLLLLFVAACGKKKDDAPAPPIIVKPSELVRTAGQPAIQPDATTAQAMVSAGRKRVITSWKVCVDRDGAVDEATAITPSGFVTWDQALAAGIRTWKFQPVMKDREPVRACTSFTFAWSP